MKLVFIYGPPAVGKLTVAKALAKITGYPIVDNHTLINPLADVFGWDHPERARLADLFRVELFRSAARAGKDVITTSGRGGHSADAFIQNAKHAVESEGGHVLFVHLVAPKEVLMGRVGGASRSKHNKMIKPEELAAKLESTPDVFARALVPEHLEIDASTHAAEHMADMIVEHYALQKSEAAPERE